MPASQYERFADLLLRALESRECRLAEIVVLLLALGVVAQAAVGWPWPAIRQAGFRWVRP